jgi:DNA mismatch repair protein MutS
MGKTSNKTGKKQKSSKPPQETIIDFYLRHVKEYKEKYGDQTIVFIQNGGFMEIYAYEEDNPLFDPAKFIMGLQVAKKSGVHAKKVGYMSGIPLGGMRKYYKMLVKNNYTVVIITQITSPPEKVIRKVTKIMSPGCILSEDIHDSSDLGNSSFVNVMIEIDEDFEYFINICVFDSNLGTTKLQSIHLEDDTVSDNSKLLVRLRDVISTLNFNEILFNYILDNSHIKNDLNNKDNTKQVIDVDVGTDDTKTLQYHKQRVHNTLKHILLNVLTHEKVFYQKEIIEFRNQNYQKDFLEEYFHSYKTNYCSIFENLGITNMEPSLLINLILMLNFVGIHDESLTKNLPRPEITNYENENTLQCYNEAYTKLNVFDFMNDKKKSLFHYINFTSSKPAQRMLYDRLRHPILNHAELEMRYNLVGEILDNPDYIEKIENNLKIVDLQRIYRRFSIGKLNPYEIPRIEYANEQILDLIKLIKSVPEFKLIKQELLPSDEVIALFKEYTEKITSIFNMEKCSKTNLRNISDTLFTTGFDTTIDKYVTKKNKLYQIFITISTELSNFVEQGSDYILVRLNDKGYWLDISKLRGVILKEELKDKLKNNQNLSIPITNGDTEYNISPFDLSLRAIEYDTKNKNNMKINSNQMKVLSTNTLETTAQIISFTKEKYVETIEKLYDDYYSKCIDGIIKFITHIDLVKSNAKCAQKFRYCRPTLFKRDDDISEINVKQIRHPIIEQLLRDEGKKYIPNDLIVNNDENHLIYGVNSVGKSSLLKSLPLSVIMAQAGLYVPASEFRLALYERLFVRMGNDDNLFVSHSSFVKEMLESKEIMKRMNKNSLVIADELCASTEFKSAYKIVAAIMEMLTRHQASFVFATHMFVLVDTNIYKRNDNIKCKHLKVRFEKELIFDRTLSEGLPENRTYGILVACKTVQDDEFNEIINNNDNFGIEDLDTNQVHKSKYNAKVILKSCQVCDYLPKSQTDIPLETHHINMQCEADKEGFHGIYHKNEVHNLVVLCRGCHQKVHQDEIRINGYLDTDAGLKLDYITEYQKYLANSNIVSVADVSDESEDRNVLIKPPTKSKKTSNSIYTNELKSWIGKYYNDNQYKSKQRVVNEIRKKKDIKLSMATFNKIIS